MGPFRDSHVTTAAVWGARWLASGEPDVEEELLL
jgi:hypothetical protein